jgi:hypothetical protein
MPMAAAYQSATMQATTVRTGRTARPSFATPMRPADPAPVTVASAIAHPFQKHVGQAFLVVALGHPHLGQPLAGIEATRALIG